MADFEKALPPVLEAEGGYTCDPDDPGGATNWGITHEDVAWFRGVPEVPPIEVKNLKLEEAKSIYRKKYWDPLNLSRINSDLSASLIFDQAVNRGVGTVGKQVQRVLNAVGFILPVDGIFGNNTIDALNKVSSRSFSVAFFKASQQSYVVICQNNKTMLKFLPGWVNRTHAMLDRILD